MEVSVLVVLSNSDHREWGFQMGLGDFFGKIGQGVLGTTNDKMRLMQMQGNIGHETEFSRKVRPQDTDQVQSTSKGNFCSNCGVKRLNENANFCASCGAQL